MLDGRLAAGEQRGCGKISMNIKILYDNHAKPGFESGWGFSALVDGTTLFDTGENAVALLTNLQAFGIQPGQIERVVLSHDDWDHTGGLAIVKMCGSVDVFVPASMAKETTAEIEELNGKCRLTRVTNYTELGPDLGVTGELGEGKKEISLIAQVREGVVLLTGCAHPGLDRVMAVASDHGSIQAVVGGFHGFAVLSALSKVPVIVPCHCTQMKQEMLKMYPKQARLVAAGVQFDL